MSANLDRSDPLLFDYLQAAGGEPRSMYDAYFEMGALGFPSLESHEAGPLPAGTHFHVEPVLYSEPWSGRNDPWDGP